MAFSIPKVHQLKKSTPPSVVAVVTNMSYDLSLAGMVQELLLQEQSDELDSGISRRQQQYHLPLAMVTVTAIEVNPSVIGRLKSTSISAASMQTLAPMH